MASQLRGIILQAGAELSVCLEVHAQGGVLERAPGEPRVAYLDRTGSTYEQQMATLYYTSAAGNEDVAKELFKCLPEGSNVVALLVLTYVLDHFWDWQGSIAELEEVLWGGGTRRWQKLSLLPEGEPRWLELEREADPNAEVGSTEDADLEAAMLRELEASRSAATAAVMPQGGTTDDDEGEPEVDEVLAGSIQKMKALAISRKSAGTPSTAGMHSSTYYLLLLTATCYYYILHTTYYLLLATYHLLLTYLLLTYLLLTLTAGTHSTNPGSSYQGVVAHGGSIAEGHAEGAHSTAIVAGDGGSGGPTTVDSADGPVVLDLREDCAKHHGHAPGGDHSCKHAPHEDGTESTTSVGYANVRRGRGSYGLNAFANDEATCGTTAGGGTGSPYGNDNAQEHTADRSRLAATTAACSDEAHDGLAGPSSRLDRTPTPGGGPSFPATELSDGAQRVSRIAPEHVETRLAEWTWAVADSQLVAGLGGLEGDDAAEVGAWGERLVASTLTRAHEAAGTGLTIRWMNAAGEEGLPYDIRVDNGEVVDLYVEVKSTVSTLITYYLLLTT